jgi:hypothetical protein
MTLSRWADLHRSDLAPEQSNKSMIAELRAVADREIRDAETVESSDGRLGHAHSACLAVAAAAPAASGYRAPQDQRFLGNRQRQPVLHAAATEISSVSLPVPLQPGSFP